MMALSGDIRITNIATALTEAWARNGAPNRTPKEVVDFYCAIYDALEQAQDKSVSAMKEAQAKSKGEARYMVVQWTCMGILALLAGIAILLLMFMQ
jgi:hypothetical protein